MTPPDDPDSIARDALNVARQLGRQIRALLGRDHVAKRLFFAGDGQLSDAAVEWLGWLGKRAFLDEPTWDPDARTHAFNEGRRSIALEILASLTLDQRRLAALKRQLKEEQDDGGS